MRARPHPLATSVATFCRLRCRLLCWRALGLALAVAALPGCYVAMRAGPAYHATSSGGPTGGVGFEWDVTTGVEVYLDKPAVLNPLAGKTRVAMGGGGVASSYSDDGVADGTPAARTTDGAMLPPRVASRSDVRAAGGLMTLEVGRTLGQHAEGGSADDPRTGVLVRAVGGMGVGGGTLDLGDRSGAASILTLSAGVEAGLHGGGSTIDSAGLFIGAGVRWSRYDATDLGAAESIAPYVSLSVEGGALVQVLGEMVRGLGKSGWSCH